MANVKIKEVSKSDLPQGQKETESILSVYSGFKFGFGIFMGFLTGIVILCALTAAIWYGMLAIR